MAEKKPIHMTKSSFCMWMNTEDKGVDSHKFCSTPCDCKCHGKPAKAEKKESKVNDAARGRAGEATDPGLAEKPKRKRQAKKGGGE